MKVKGVYILVHQMIFNEVTQYYVVYMHFVFSKYRIT